ncbi:MAG: CBS domain-containing protein [Xenococcus sp. (in: cyanobacteria)]
MKLLDYKKMPPVAALMQPFPYFAEFNATVAQAVELMKSHNFRHLPIKQNDRVVGIISERDLRWMGNPSLALPATDEIPVSHVMTFNPYLVEIDTPLTTVIAEMTERKIGAAIVTSAGRLAGIVTVIDLCRALRELLDSEFPEIN